MKIITKFSATSGLNLTIQKGRYYEIWMEWPERNVLLSKIAKTDTEEKARIFLEAYTEGFSKCYNN